MKQLTVIEMDRLQMRITPPDGRSDFMCDSLGAHARRAVLYGGSIALLPYGDVLTLDVERSGIGRIRRLLLLLLGVKVL